MYAKLSIVSRSGRCCRHEVLSATYDYGGRVRCYQEATGIYWSTRKDYWCLLQCKGELPKQHVGGLEYQAIINTVAILNYWIKLFFPDGWGWHITTTTTTTTTGPPTAIASNCSLGENGEQEGWGWHEEVADMRMMTGMGKWQQQGGDNGVDVPGQQHDPLPCVLCGGGFFFCSN